MGKCDAGGLWCWFGGLENGGGTGSTLDGFPGKTLQRYAVKLSIVEGYSRNNDLDYQLVRIMDL